MSEKFMTRRMFHGAIAGAAALSLRAQAPDGQPPSRLSARPSDAPSPKSAMPPGVHRLMLREERDALLYIPESARREKAPLIVSLHGATRDADRGIELLQSLADEHGFLLLAPASVGQTWDVIQNTSFGADVAFINRSLARTFELRKIDPARIGMAGFSDGASYSLSLGLFNGDMFSAVFGFSPGFVVPGDWIGRPPVFISHGTIDPVLPIDVCSRRIVPRLKTEGYRVTYREFEGKHTLPPEVAAEAMQWFMAA
jgi:phospholipase/carboxylesterase